MRFLDEKLQTFGQFCTFLPDAKRAGQPLVEVFEASLRGIPWMEALNLCTVGRLEDLVPASG